MTGRDDNHYRCLGVGVGPANLSLACLLHGHADVPSLFLDKKPAFGWHEGQLMPGTTLQVSMLKDLVSLADPTNPFSFLSYLHDQGKIYHFINAQFDAVPRQEFRNYLRWASIKNPSVSFDEEVQSVDFVRDRFVVQTKSRELTADNISVGVGVVPSVPPQALPHIGETQFHISEFVARAVELGGKRVCVVGGGQSGAEAFLNLISRSGGQLPREVSWVSRRQNFFPIDDSPFTNDYYMPCHSDYFFSLQRELREAFNNRHVLTSDGISGSTLQEIYQRLYHLRFIDNIEGVSNLYPNRSVSQVAPGETGWRLTLTHNDWGGLPEEVETDVVVWATGYVPAPLRFLDPLANRLSLEDREFKIDLDFAAVWDGPARNNIFFQNAARLQRGLADPNLSLMAWRSQRIADRIRGTKSESPQRSFVEWSPRLAAKDVP